MPVQPDIRFRFVRPELPPVAEWAPFLEAAYTERWFSNGGPVSCRLEREIAETWAPEGREPVLVSSATSGLVAALLALDVRGPVAVPSFTFPATAHAVLLAGCTPVLCDVSEATWELDPAAVASAVARHHCRAIVHVRAMGMCRDLSALEAVAAAAKIPLVVDAAAAFGGRLDDGTPVGGAGDAEVMSFHATKPFAIGEGGALFASPRIAARVRRVINFSIVGTDVEGRGLNAKLSDITAAVGLGMLRRFDQQLSARARSVDHILSAVREGGSGHPPTDAGRPPWQCLPLDLVTTDQRDTVLAELERAGIEARTYYAPGLHRTRAFRAYASDMLPMTEALAGRLLCLPVYPDASQRELDVLTTALRSAVALARIG